MIRADAAPEGEYQVGAHSSDIEALHVAFVLDGHREKLFDVQLYSLDIGNDQDGAYIESKEALDLLVARANQALAAS